MNDQDYQKAARVIKAAAPDFSPKLALTVGSGLGSLAESISNPIHIAYDDLPGFSSGRVKGHSGTLTLGELNGLAVVCLQGRAHYYEGHNDEVMRNSARTLKLLGCEVVLLTNASASLRPNIEPV